MATYKTPGVYVEEVSTLPPSVAEVSTAIPVFIGYTEKSGDLQGKPVRINTMLEFEQTFGKAYPAAFEVTLDANEQITAVTRKDGDNFLLYYSLKLYFDNGGGACYVVSTGDFSVDDPDSDDFEKALDNLRKEDEPTLIVLTDAASLDKSEYYNLCGLALKQCAELGDRFLIADVITEAQDEDADAGKKEEATTSDSKTGDEKKPDAKKDDIQDFRNGIGTNYLRYGAAYTPYLQTLIPYYYTEETVTIPGGDSPTSSYKQADVFEVTCKGKDATKSTVKVDIVNTPAATKKSTTAATTTEGGTTPAPAAPTVQFKVTETALEITITGKGMTGTALAGKWEEWKAVSTNVPGGFGIKALPGGSAEVVAIAATTLKGVISLQAKRDSSTAQYNKIKTELAKQRVTLPPSAAIAGIYARTDRERGVWKAPANVSLISVLAPVVKISDQEQENLNIDPEAGKSINVIRSFTGKGTLVWGARTLAGNDNEWRYISVRRLFNLIEESTKKATAFAVFEPNDATTWLKVKAMIDSYLYGLWQQGALAGATAEMAYYVNVGLGKTMTTQDVLEGRMIVDIGVAAVRPAEFIVIRFMHKLQQA